MFNPDSAGTDFRRQNLTSVEVRFWRLTYKVGPGTVRGKIFIMAVEHRYSNESERANYDSYDDFKLKNPLVSNVFIKIQRFKG